MTKTIENGVAVNEIRDSVHESRALEEAEKAPTCRTNKSARHGDIVMFRVGDSKSRGAATPDFGTLIAAGKHGEHRMIAKCFERKNDVVDLAEGGLLVHTDLPDARHGSIWFEPGCYRVKTSRELRGNEVVKVED